MKQYTVLFELYGKKLKTTIKADSMAELNKENYNHTAIL